MFYVFCERGKMVTLKTNKCFLFLSLLFSVQLLSAQFLEKVFTDIFNNNIWAYKSETISGTAASFAYTEAIRKELPALFKKYNISSILDIGCGDFNWMKHIISDEITYIGVDVVKQIVDDNNAKYKTKNISFIHADCSCDSLPQVDLVMCRDIFPYVPYKYAFRMIKNILSSGSKYVLFTSYSDPQRENRNLPKSETGGNYCLNILKKPFFLMKPLFSINEQYSIPTADKSLGLWHVADLNKGSSAVTYLDEKNWGGRLGDKLLMYVKAKWVAYTYGLPFYYKPFKYSDQLQMHEKELRCSDEHAARYEIIDDPCKSIGIENPKNRSVDVDNFIQPFSSKLHVISYYFQPERWGSHQAVYDSQDVGEWKGLYDDEEFRKMLRETIQPRFPIHEIPLPKDRLTVALHVRKGGGFDGEMLSLQLYGDKRKEEELLQCHCQAQTSCYTDVGYTLKFPPDRFYVEQIRNISSMYEDIPMYVHLFTDDLDPQSLIDRYAKAVGKSNISYGCRQVENHHDKNLIDDLFNMVRCNCLIRSGSNFPQVAQLIGNYKVVLYPKNVEWRSILHVYDVGMKSDSNIKAQHSADTF